MLNIIKHHSLINRSINFMPSSFTKKFSFNTSHRLSKAVHTPSRTLSNCSSKLYCSVPPRLEVKANFSLTTTQARHYNSAFQSFCGLFNHCSLHNLHGGCTNNKKYCSNSNNRETFDDELNFWKEEFERNEVVEPELSAKHIMNHVKKVEPTLNSSNSPVLTNEEREKIATLMTCRLQRMPVQYIIGEWDFHSITLDMRPPVFIPRPETETLVNETLKLLEKKPEDKHVLELCCGSGAISLALLHNLPSLRCVAVDQSGSAVTLTAHNAKKLQLDDRLTVCHSKIDTDLKWRDALPSNQLYDVIVSNPPYVPSVLVPTLQPEILIYEDLRALDGGRDGMELVKKIILQSHHLLKKNGHLLLEVDPSHATLLPKWLKTVADENPLQISRIIKDLDGKNRFIHLLKVER